MKEHEKSFHLMRNDESDKVKKQTIGAFSNILRCLKGQTFKFLPFYFGF